MNKKKSIRKHLEKRTLERTGAAMSPGMHRELVNHIQSGKAKPAGRTSLNRTLFRMQVVGHPMIVVYDKKRKQVVTMWPEEGGEDESRDH